MKWFSTVAKMFEGGAGKTLLLFSIVLAILFHGLFVPDQIPYSNDGPLGELMAQCHRLPDRFTGCWADLGSVGFDSGPASPNISFGLQWLLKPVLFAKFYAVSSLLLLGFGAWCFFRQSRLTPVACVLGGLATMLNSTFFSLACWGVASQDITVAMFFLAMAALMDVSSRWRWWRVILAGLAVGMGVAEGADVGAIFSVYLAAFVIYQAWVAEGSRAVNLLKGSGRLTVIVLCAVLLAIQSIYALTTTSIKGVAGTQQDIQTKDQRWDWATQWSLPKQEMLGLVVPGLFGYRMDTTGGGNYWGAVGRDATWLRYFKGESQSPPPSGKLVRYSGGGNYAGVLILLLALWAAAQSLLRKSSVFNPGQRKWLWFWLGVAILSLLLALGRYAPFYRLLYALPYFSTIRNPVKFLGPFSVAVVALFAFGVDGLQRRYMMSREKVAASRWPGFENWWKRAARFEKRWVYGCGLFGAASLLAWWIYASHGYQLEQYMRFTQVEGDLNSVVNFSVHQVGWFILFFFLAAGLMVLIFSGAFVGKRAGGVLLGLLLILDLALANQPWIVYWNYHDKYATNLIVDALKDKPYEHRVVLAPIKLPPQEAVLSQLYKIEWMQHQFPFYNIQSFDTVEMSRVPEDFSAFLKAFKQTGDLRRISRAWQLTNTRYVIAPVGFGIFWNQQASNALPTLQTVTRFSVVAKPGFAAGKLKLDQITVAPAPDGRFAIFEYPDALPRAKLYNQWQVSTDDSNALEQIFSPEFNPKSSVVVDGNLPPGSAMENTSSEGPSAGVVDFTHYAPKDVQLKAEASGPSVLMLADHFDPDWKVFVDKKAAPLLRCNYLMRGVYLAPGNHDVEFKFQPPVGTLYVSTAVVAMGMLLLGAFIVSTCKNRPAPPTPVSNISQSLVPQAKIAQARPPQGKRKAVANRTQKSR